MQVLGKFDLKEKIKPNRLEKYTRFSFDKKFLLIASNF